MAITDVIGDARVQQFALSLYGHITGRKRHKEQQDLMREKHESDRQILLDIYGKVDKIGDRLDGTIEATVTGEATEAGATVYSRYAPDMDVSVGCVPCTRAHLATVSAALQEGQAAAAREEIVALLEYDLTPQKLAATPERDREVLRRYAGKMQDLRAQLAGPVPDSTVAAASLKEALRFAREDGMDHPEVQIRVQRTEEAINALERVKLAPEQLAKLPPDQAKAAKAALPALRKARQDLLNHAQTADDLEAVTARIATLDQQLNPPPPEETLEQLAEQAKTLNSEFRRDVMKAWKSTKEGDAHAADANAAGRIGADETPDSEREHRSRNRRRQSA